MSGFMIAIISAIHVFACVALIVSILLQSGKGGGLAGAFGAGSSQTLFGGRGAATFLTRASTVMAVVFFLTSLTLGLTSARQSSPVARSLMQEDARRRAAAQQQGAGDQGAPGTTAPGSTAPGAAPGTAPEAPGTVMPAPGSGAPTPGTMPSQSPPTPAPQGGATPQKSGTK
ncbi:MAG: preprotein translocase subunit SecG [Candidatus Eisenbacteria bacterium]|uniref:Protein-export membrane protein SecG n=1 Tax=Eiseniibacteriota bacterium TaxID=2212470 RepID=A0A538TUI1_UNCEI|nr:MAG: preprotein translocase subunit SecG [Candidatus Eisenbacteria bacterium]